MYIPGRRRTASRPFRTWIESAPYSPLPLVLLGEAMILDSSECRVQSAGCRCELLNSAPCTLHFHLTAPTSQRSSRILPWRPSLSRPRIRGACKLNSPAQAGNDVVKPQRRLRPASSPKRIALQELEGDGGSALLSGRANGAQWCALQQQHQVVTMRPDCRPSHSGVTRPRAG